MRPADFRVDIPCGLPPWRIFYYLYTTLALSVIGGLPCKSTERRKLNGKGDKTEYLKRFTVLSIIIRAYSSSLPHL